MTEATTAATVSVVLLSPEPHSPGASCANRALARGEILEIVRATGRFEALAPEVLAGARNCRGDFVLVLTPDAALPEHAWPAIAAAGAGDADAVRIDAATTAADPAWRGRRARAHERNLESVRFAHLIPPGALAVRRQLLVACLDSLGPDWGADWWRELVRRVLCRARVERARVMVARPKRAAGEPACPGFAAPAPVRRPQVVVLGQIEVSTSLYFDFLEAETETSVSFRALTSLAVEAPHLARADLVVLVRELHRFWDEGVIEFLASAGVPFVYFTDDNFLALAAEGAAPGFYAPSRVRRALAGAAELWCSTPALAGAYASLHPRVRVWGPVLDPALAAPPASPSGPLTVAIAGGDFRLAGLRGAPIERLRAIASARPLRLMLTEAAAHALSPSIRDAEILVRPAERSFRQFVRGWRRDGVDILLHPAGPTANAPFKCPTAVIVAGYMGATPVVEDEPAYAGWTEAEGVLRLGVSAEGLALAADGARRSGWREAMTARLQATLAERFGAAGRRRMLAAAYSATPGRGEVRVRDVLASARFRRRMAELSLVHAARWMTALAR